jgi:hypothetical protein
MTERGEFTPGQNAPSDLDLSSWAWTIIANAGGGEWSNEAPKWVEAAEKWREAYHAALAKETSS